MPNVQQIALLENFGNDQTREILRIVFPLLKKYKLTNRLPGNLPVPHHRALSESEKHNDPNYYSPRYREYDNLYELYIDVYARIMQRCYNKNEPSYMYYGGRGIRVYKPWKEDREKFIRYCIKHLGNRPERYYFIDRIDNNKGYIPGNIRWVHPRISALNRNTSICLDENVRCAASYIYKYYNITQKKLLLMFIREHLIKVEYSPRLQLSFNMMVHRHIINV